MQAPTVFRDGLLRGQVVMVSGGGGGIGRAICHLVGRLGASVEVLTVDGGSQAWGEFWPLGKPDHFKLED